MKIALVNIWKRDAELLPMGLLLLSSWLRARLPQHTFDLIDAVYTDPLTELVRAKPPYDLLGISCMTDGYNEACRLAQDLANLKVPIVLGGIHISRLPESFKNLFTVGVIGEGEETLAELIRLFESTATPAPADFEKIQGVVFMRDGKPVATAPRPAIDLSDYPPIDFAFIHPEHFTKRILFAFTDVGVGSCVSTSRGCPYKCAFCASSHFWRTTRYHSVDWVLAEIRKLVERGATHIHFVDDLFAAHKKRMRAIAEGIRANGWHRRIEFAACARANLCDDETCEILKSMNVQSVFFGFESGNDRVLKYLKGDTVSVQDNKDAILRCVRHGLRPWGNLIIGSPTERLEEMEDSAIFARWAYKAGADRVTMSVLTPFPGTPMWKIAEERGKVSTDMDFDRLCNQATGEGLQGHLVEPEITPEQFRAMCFRLLKEVHRFKWRKAWRMARKHPLAMIRLVLASPWSLIKRMFVSKIP